MYRACRAALTLVLCGCACCGHAKPRAPEPSTHGATVELAITGPTIIVIVPPDAAPTSATHEKYDEEIAVIRLALADAKLCLAPVEPSTSLVPAARLVLVRGGKRTLVYPQPNTGAVDAGGEAVILVRSDVEPRTILRGTRSIGAAILSDLAAYFEVASCDPSEYPQ